MDLITPYEGRITSCEGGLQIANVEGKAMFKNKTYEKNEVIHFCGTERNSTV
jgi:hypothetical protein